MKTLTGWLIVPKDKKDREQYLEGNIYLTLFRDKEYRDEFKKQWMNPGTKVIKATLTIETE